MGELFSEIPDWYAGIIGVILFLIGLVLWNRVQTNYPSRNKTTYSFKHWMNELTAALAAIGFGIYLMFKVLL
ncbi:hypothetical protein GCM10023186_14030 [Hymenobacter koreensis]|uniref:Uncharacterized protein n=1 Tax=Hymenobacter koreensis TaxID=1084523 RepID=A0ABP8IX74_9BACT